MGQILRGSATTTEAVRRAIQNSQASLRALSKRYGIKTTRAVRESAKQGFWNGATPPLGYKIIEAERRGQHATDEREAGCGRHQHPRRLYPLNHRRGRGRRPSYPDHRQQGYPPGCHSRQTARTEMFVVLYANGAPDTIRTCDLCLRRATLYPAELRVHGVHLADWPGLGNGPAWIEGVESPSHH
jgi:hypothetical protein